MKVPDAWLYEEYDSNGALRAKYIWFFLPADLTHVTRLKDVHHFDLTPLYLDVKEKQRYSKEQKFNSKRLVEAFCGH
jgi:hypothetical protein